ncbi:hypothetical protein D9757_008207 [Collybiopsis confluens]|uniref:Uncharacterized protein n=1 Tax=Collybiopsis confluens TaxID=2823264 RepID=A0A8H5M4A4_9AGAR|nr:hypothetical protein D9757_008207 [Collybiopsis confluens]
MMRPSLFTANLVAVVFGSVLAVVAITVPVVQGTGSSQCVGHGTAYIDPRKGGGSMLDASAGFGEPLNVIISGLSSPGVLDPTKTFYNYAKAIGFSYECLGLHIGNPQQANLGDGRGWINETAVLREDYGNPGLGTCGESLVGGNHFRIWQQEGTCALFLAVSIEQDASEHHNIVSNGYDLGRDALVDGAVGIKTFNEVTYSTTVQSIGGLLPVGANGINHSEFSESFLFLIDFLSFDSWY